MKYLLHIAIYLTLVAIAPARAQLLFSDDFEDGAAPEWGNEFGDWVVVDGVYTASVQSNDPPTYTSVTSLPNLVDFTIELDINGVRDGGVFLRSQRCDDGLVDGVLFVVGGYNGSYNGCYWHICQCDGISGPLNLADVPGLQGSDVHIRLVVSGNDYFAFLADDSQPITTLTTDSHPSGSVALYEYYDQAFDNVLISGSLTGIGDESRTPRAAINSVYPNPFNPQTTITFEVGHLQLAEIAVFDLTGRLLGVLARRTYDAGNHSIVWDGKDATGRMVPSGNYVVRLSTESTTQARKVLLLR